MADYLLVLGEAQAIAWVVQSRRMALGEVLTIAKAASELDVSTATEHRWLREGFITGEQITPGAPWQIRLTPELRARLCEHAPDGWLSAQVVADAHQDLPSESSVWPQRRCAPK